MRRTQGWRTLSEHADAEGELRLSIREREVGFDGGNDGEEKVESERAEQRECRQDDVERAERHLRSKRVAARTTRRGTESGRSASQRFYDKIGVLTLSWYLSPWNNTAP